MTLTRRELLATTTATVTERGSKIVNASKPTALIWPPAASALADAPRVALMKVVAVVVASNSRRVSVMDDPSLASSRELTSRSTGFIGFSYAGRRRRDGAKSLRQSDQLGFSARFQTKQQKIWLGRFPPPKP
jgi:hypothetical protein